MIGGGSCATPRVSPPRRCSAAASRCSGRAAAGALAADENATGPKLEGVVESAYRVDEELTPYSDITSYNNFYEFGTDKRDPSRHAGDFTPRPWTVKVLGECEKPGEYDYEDIVKPHRLEERIYRLRCVEAWSMVIPWIGIPLADVLPRFAPTSKAKYVAFRTVFRPEEMRGQRRHILDWPYVEGLRIDEAMHPLTLLTVGLYGEVLPNQNGAPIRLVLPWKYGFKSIKSVASIEFTEQEPPTSWKPGSSERVRVLLERKPDRLPPAVEPKARAAHRRAVQAQNADVQRLRGPGREPLHGYEPQGELLSSGSAMNRERADRHFEDRNIRRGSRPVHGARLRRVLGWARREPGRDHHPHHGRLDVAPAPRDARDHPAPPPDRLGVAHPGCAGWSGCSPSST